ncbi:hypothetical protein AAVH_18811 [Aphelenchoides avenae]|nr:hypothetical protein AAVH_18811 [Aphelenchus avenae]
MPYWTKRVESGRLIVNFLRVMDILSHPRPTASNSNEQKKCLVCGVQAHCVHFGALSCKSCAERILVPTKRDVPGAQNRFEGVLELPLSTMHGQVMCVLRVQAAHDTALATSLTAACIQPGLRYTIAANRCQKLRNFGSPTRFENRPACKGTIVKAFWSELRVLRDYFCSLDDDFYALLKDDATPALLAESFCVEWSLFETALTTLQRCGQKKQRLHFVDRSLVEITDSGLARFYGSDLQIRDLPMVVDFCLERYLRFLEFVKRLGKAALDDVEQTAFDQLLFAQCCEFTRLVYQIWARPESPIGPGRA